MPTYEYRCDSCGSFEVQQKISEKALVDCPSCAKQGKRSPVERLISAAAFHLKGSGWYKDLYSKGSSGSAPAASGTEAAPASGSSESKPAAATESAAAPKSCGTGCGCH